jgi:hypothetical protein
MSKTNGQAEAGVEGMETSGSDVSTKRKEKLQDKRPRTMKGIERRRVARRPTVSIVLKATSVKMKLVRAIESEANIGEVKPTRAKIVAEKYMSEFCERNQRDRTIVRRIQD